MDLRKELEAINIKEMHPLKIVEQIKQEQAELANKLHIFNVISIAQCIEEMIISGLFKKENVRGIKLSYRNDPALNINTVSFELFDLNDELFKYGSKITPSSFWKLDRLFEDLDGFYSENINEQFKENEVKYIELKEGAKEIFLNLFLSKKFISYISYGEMQNELGTKEITNKRPKL